MVLFFGLVFFVAPPWKFSADARIDQHNNINKINALLFPRVMHKIYTY